MRNRPLTDEELKYCILRTIGIRCDEVVDGKDKYFRVDLVETTEDHYFDDIKSGIDLSFGWDDEDI